MSSLILIPSRIGSTRLPRKALADINGKSMISRVVECVMQVPNVESFVATDSHEISNDLKKINFENIIMTDSDIPNGTMRIHKAMEKIDKDFDFVVNVQGDMPNLDPKIIQKVIDVATINNLPITTVCHPIFEEEAIKKSVVKVVLEKVLNKDYHKALYFSRNVIPCGAETLYGHAGIYVYRRDVLDFFVNATQTDIEKTESLEQLRAIVHGIDIFSIIINNRILSIDTPEDLVIARELIK